MVNVLFSVMIDVSMAILGVLHPTMLWEQFLCIGLGCVALAFGIVIELAPNVVVVPGEAWSVPSLRSAACAWAR